MEITLFLAKFWGSLFMILGGLSVGAKLLGRTIEMTEDRAITVSTGYITFLLGLATVVLHNVWVMDWRVIITILGWTTLLKGLTKNRLSGARQQKSPDVQKQARALGRNHFPHGRLVILDEFYMTQ